MIFEILTMDGYNLGKIAITSILGIKVIVVGLKFFKGLGIEHDVKVTGEGAILAFIYYMLPHISNFIKGVV